VLPTKTGVGCISIRGKIAVLLAQREVHADEADEADPDFVRSTITIYPRLVTVVWIQASIRNPFLRRSLHTASSTVVARCFCQTFGM